MSPLPACCQLAQPDIVERVLRAQRSSGLRAGMLRLELTETDALSDAAAVERLAELRRHGVGIQLDDFGTGYSSLGHLGQLPIDGLKLDRSLLESSRSNHRGAKILEAVIALARELELGVTAEGIETPEQAERVRALACESGQGFYFHRPLNGRAAAELIVA